MPLAEQKAQRKRMTTSRTCELPKTVLVIDDEERVRTTIQSLIEKLGYRVLGADSAGAALEQARTFDGNIDLALLDIKLPDMEGGNLYPLIKQLRPDMKVIICSGYSLDVHVEQILKGGADGFLQKPFALKTIADKIKEVLEEPVQ